MRIIHFLLKKLLFDLCVTVPPPNVSLFLSREYNLLPSNVLTLTCTIVINDVVDTPTLPVIKWTKTSLSNGSDVTDISSTTEVSSNLYQSQLVLLEDNGNYSCSVVIESEVDYVHDSVKVTKFQHIIDSIKGN